MEHFRVCVKVLFSQLLWAIVWLLLQYFSCQCNKFFNKTLFCSSITFTSLFILNIYLWLRIKHNTSSECDVSQCCVRTNIMLFSRFDLNSNSSIVSHHKTVQKSGSKGGQWYVFLHVVRTKQVCCGWRCPQNNVHSVEHAVIPKRH